MILSGLRGFSADFEASKAAQAASSVWWIARTVQVYWKKDL